MKLNEHLYAQKGCFLFVYITLWHVSVLIHDRPDISHCL